MKKSKAHKQAKKKTRAAPSGRRSNRSFAREVTHSAPVSRQVFQTGVVKPLAASAFGTAAPHDMFPLGGMRISAEASNTTSDALVSDSVDYGAWIDAAGTVSGRQWVGISPSAFIGASFCSNMNMFGASSVMTNISRWFRYFRFRKLDLIYETSSTTATSGNIQFDYHSNAYDVVISASVSKSQPTLANSTSVRFPLWTVQAEIPLIRMEKPAKDDKLFTITTSDDSIVIDATNTQNVIYFQGAVAATLDGLGANTTFARYRWRYVIDLYDFQQFVPAAITSEDEKKNRELLVARQARVLRRPTNLSVTDIQKVDLQRYVGVALTDPYTDTLNRTALPVSVSSSICTDVVSEIVSAQPYVGHYIASRAGDTALGTVPTVLCSTSDGTGAVVPLYTTGLPVDVTPQSEVMVERKVLGKSLSQETGGTPILVEKGVTPTATAQGQRSLVDLQGRTLVVPQLRRQ